MAKGSNHPQTLAVRELIAHQVEFTPFEFAYEEKGGTKHSSKTLGVPEHEVIKTLIMETDRKEPLIVLMHGDLQVSTKNLARTLQVKSINPCKPEVADNHSGYQVGGTSPFGTRKKMPVYVEKTILELEHIYINGGKRGFLVRIKTTDLTRVLNPIVVEVAQAPSVK